MPAWPKPVWGAPPPRAYERERFRRLRRAAARRSGSRKAAVRLTARASRASFGALPEFLMSAAPISGRSRSSAIPQAFWRASPSGAAMRLPRRLRGRRARRHVRDRRRTRGDAPDRERSRSAVPRRRGARARAGRRDRVPRACGRGRPLRHRARSGGDQGAEGRPDLVVTDLRSIAVQGLVAPDHLRAARRSEGAARLARAASLLRQLRRADHVSRRPAGSANARPARSSISRAPIRS